LKELVGVTFGENKKELVRGNIFTFSKKNREKKSFGRKWREAKNKGSEPICCSFWFIL